MPEMNGFEFLEEYGKLSENIKKNITPQTHSKKHSPIQTKKMSTTDRHFP